MERWFAELTTRKLRRSAHRSVTDLEQSRLPGHLRLEHGQAPRTRTWTGYQTNDE